MITEICLLLLIISVKFFTELFFIIYYVLQMKQLGTEPNLNPITT